MIRRYSESWVGLGSRRLGFSSIGPLPGSLWRRTMAGRFLSFNFNEWVSRKEGRVAVAAVRNGVGLGFDIFEL